ncbi:MAG: AAA family ATPase [Polyangiaceae bacterium]|nr:AAA family ATPase [Polyangiaceae bacterium]
MRIQALDLLAYGHLRGTVLDFRGSGLHVVFGCNEAGKSTTLRAITGLLYGIDERTRDAHTVSPKDLRIGGVLASDDGHELRVVRRKARANTLLDMIDQPVDESKLLRLLRGVTEPMFRHAFGLDHEALKKGAEALMAGRGDLGESLFDASVGAGGEVQRLLAELAAEADRIYRPRGSTLPLNQALKTLTIAQKQIREKWHLPEAYAIEQRALDEAESQRRELLQKKVNLASRRAQIECARARIPLEKKRARLLEARAPLLPFVTPATNEARFASLAPRLVGYERASEALGELKVQIERMRNRVADAERHVGGRISALASFDSHAWARIQSLVQERITLAAKLESAHLEAARIRHDLSRLDEQSLVATNADGAHLLRALGAVQALGDAEGRLAQARVRAARKRAELSRRAASMGLFDGSLDAFVELAVPAPDTVDRLLSKELELERIRLRQDEQWSDKTNEAHSLARQIAEHTGDFALPSPNDLHAARERRDEAWASVRGHSELDDAVRARRESEFDRAIREADRVADSMIREAERVTSLARLTRSAAALSEQMTAMEVERVEAAKAMALLEREHCAAWQRAAINPLSFMEMKAWLERHTKIVEDYALVQEAEAAIADLESSIALARTDLEAALEAGDGANATSAKGTKSAKNQSLSDLMLEATSRTERIEATKRAIAEANRMATKLGAELGERTRTIEKDEGELARVSRELAALVRPLGIAEDGRSEEVMRALEAWRELGSLAEKLSDLEGRQASYEREMRMFEQDVGQLAREFAPDLETTLAPDLGKSGARDAGAVLVQRVQNAHAIENELALVGERLGELDTSPVQDDIAQLALDSDRALRAMSDCDAALADIEHELHRLGETIGGIKGAIEAMRKDSGAADASALAEQALERVRSHVERYCRVRLAQFLLSREIDKFREENQGPLLSHTSQLFSRLTLGGFSGVRATLDDRDRPSLVCVRHGGAEVEVVDLSDGTRDQLYLSLRLASLRRYAEVSEPMPLVLDDVLVQFDDDRARAALLVLADTSQLLQVLFFTHHSRIVDLAREAVPAERLHIHELTPLSI